MPGTTAPNADVLVEIEAALTALTRNPRIRGIHRLLSRESGLELDRPSYVALAMLEEGPLRVSDLADACGVDTLHHEPPHRTPLRARFRRARR